MLVSLENFGCYTINSGGVGSLQILLVMANKDEVGIFVHYYKHVYL